MVKRFSQAYLPQQHFQNLQGQIIQPFIHYSNFQTLNLKYNEFKVFFKEPHMNHILTTVLPMRTAFQENLICGLNKALGGDCKQF